MQERQSPPVLFEMMRSFTTLAQTLNLSKTVSMLGVTRQTVRRHVAALEAQKGQRFFEVRDRQYRLTEAGRDAAEEAQGILDQATSWLSGSYTHGRGAGGLDRASFRDERGHDFQAQQHSLGRLWQDSPPLLQKGFLAWANARFQIEAPEMEIVKPYLLLYRQHRDGWLCVGIGEKSSYATWFDWAWGKSAIGHFSHEDPAGEEFNEFISKAHAQIFHEGGVRLDHVLAQIPRLRDGPPVPVSFQRLLLGCLFRNGEAALAVLVARTNRIEIEGRDPNSIAAMPEELLMEFDILGRRRRAVRFAALVI